MQPFVGLQQGLFPAALCRLHRIKQASPLIHRLLSSDAPSGSLPLDLPTYTIWGANTGVGKTLASIGLAHAAHRLQLPLLYIKPVQTGFPQDSDARLVALASASDLQLGAHAAHLVKGDQAALWSGRQAGGSQSSIDPGSSGVDLPRICKVVHAWAAPMSPHAAVALEGRPVSDRDVRNSVVLEVQRYISSLGSSTSGAAALEQGKGLVVVETAGGVASPAPSGRVLCDVLRPLRLPAVLVGDPRLGGISSTISSYESLLLRGYDVDVILLADPQIPLPSHKSHTGSSTAVQPRYNNADALRAHFQNTLHRLGAPGVEVVVVPGCPPPPKEHVDGLRPGAQPVGIDASLEAWLQDTAPHFDALVATLSARHAARTAALRSAPSRALSTLWWPFTQHATLKAAGVQVIDSRWGEQWQVARVPTPAPPPSHTPDPSQASASQPPARATVGTEPHATSRVAVAPLFDACSSWWTQAVNEEAHPEIARAVGYAAGRYLHVMFPENAHEVGLAAAERLLRTVGAGWALRVFFSDNGSTAIEVALKMAFRKYMADAGLGAGSGATGGDEPLELQVVGLQNAYHGDTLGAQDCVAPSVYNARAQAPWYRGRGVFLDPPYLGVVKGSWRVTHVPDWLQAAGFGSGTDELGSWGSLGEVLDGERDGSGLADVYRAHIEGVLSAAERSNAGARRYLAALIIEPLLQGAGGMLLVDPAFQRALVQACRARGMPIIFDEVMTGLMRLGATSAASLLGVLPDIGCYAKLMTAGTAPMAATLATESVFNTFAGDSKLQALLHGHSYTAFPIGCATTVAAIDLLTSPAHNPNLCTPSGPCPTCPRTPACAAPCGRALDSWDHITVARLSHHPRVQHVVAIGTVLALTLRPHLTTASPTASSTSLSSPTAQDSAARYASSGAVDVMLRLRAVHGVYARPLGDVVYLMVPPTTSREKCDELLGALEEVLAYSPGGSEESHSGDGYVV